MRPLDVVAVGELNPDLILGGMSGPPRLGQEILAARCKFTLGSSTALCAANLAALGLSVGIVGKVGEDAFGEFVLRCLGERGIDASRVIRDAAVRTGITVSLAYPEDRAMLTFTGAMADLAAAEVDREYLASARHLHISSLFLQRDLGTAMLYYAITLIMAYVSTGSLSFLALGALGAGAGAVIGYRMNTYVQNRVRIWQNPWQDPYGISYQVVQSMVAMVNAGPWGTGLGLGNAKVIPEVETDFIFAAVFNEFGLVFGVCVVLIYLMIFLRGVDIARRANSKFHTLLALGCSCMIAVQTFVIIGGNINMIPLTGVTLPFVSYGGTSMVSSLCIMGLLQGVANANDRGLKEDQMIAMLGEEG